MPNRFFIFIVISVVNLLALNGQINTYSPYSRFGLGELQKEGNIRNLSMGSTGIALRSNNQINYINPASYTATDTMSFLFDFGLTGFQNTYYSDESEASMGNLNFHHIALAFPVTKWWKASAGVYPYTSVGYNIKEPLDIIGIGITDHFYDGNGGLNKFYIGNAVQFFNRLSIGFNMNYVFGYIYYAKKLGMSTDPAIAIPRTENRLIIGDMMYQLGIQYTQTFSEKYFITVGSTFENKSNIKTTSHLLSELYFPGRSTMIGDSILLSTSYLVSRESIEGAITYPGNLGLGISFGIKNILTVTGDYYMQDWSKSMIMGRSDSLVNSNSTHFGLEYTPSPASIRSYLGRVHYRFGSYLTNSYISIRGEQIKDYGMTFGVGLPLRNTKTTFNIGSVIGQRGTLNNNLIKENYVIMHIGITLHDIWFYKRKYD